MSAQPPSKLDDAHPKGLAHPSVPGRSQSDIERMRRQRDEQDRGRRTGIMDRLNPFSLMSWFYPGRRP